MELVKSLEGGGVPALFFGWARICWPNEPIAPRVGDDAGVWGTKAEPLVTHLAGGFAVCVVRFVQSESERVACLPEPTRNHCPLN
jgi:hypothetical protein